MVLMIHNDLTEIPTAVMSRQRRYQLRHKAAGLCCQCREPAVPGMVLCLKHAKLSMLRHHPKGARSKNTKLQRALAKAKTILMAG